MSGLKPLEVLNAVRVVCEQHTTHGAMRPVGDYISPNVSRKITRLVLSYTGYINRTVWKK
jgi:UDP-N-acetylglucosamine 2-epimerase